MGSLYFSGPMSSGAVLPPSSPLVWQRCVPTEAQRLARIEAAEFYSEQIDAFVDPDGGWDLDGGLDDDILDASWDGEALDELDA